MSTLIAESPPTGGPLTWERQMRPVLDTIGHPTPRAALVGTAGSGKSTGLHHLHDLLREDAREVVFANDALDALDDVPAEHVLLVDDLHLLSESELMHVGARAEDPSASLIIARRPWPAQPAVRAITRRLEQQLPAVVLGQVSRSDVLDHLDALDVTMCDECIAHILGATLGTSWLVAAAVQHHDPRDCTFDGSHDALDRALGELIMHRLDSADDAVRRTVEKVCVASTGDARATDDDTGDDGMLHGYAQGLLLRNGDAAPVVRTAVRQAMPTHRLIDLYAHHPEALEDRESDRPLHDARLADALIGLADRMLSAQPARAGELYDAAVDYGAAPPSLSTRRAHAAWAAGDLDRATGFVDEVLSTATGGALASMADVSAAMWAARGMMAQAAEVYRLVPPQGASAHMNAAIAALGIGAQPASAPSDEAELPTTAGVSMLLLRAGLLGTVSQGDAEAALPELVRSAEMYSSAQRTDAVVELPAVIAAVVALGLGRLATAQSVLDDAVARDHGGPWARTRLLLWSAWVAVQRAHPVDAKELLERAIAAAPTALPARDAFLLHAVRVAIARRYDDASGLEAAWHEARARLMRVDVDLYLLHPLAELISAAARIGDAARVAPMLERAQRIVTDLGDPPTWSAHVHWAGIQQGILLSRPDLLAPHAKALVAASGRSRVAAGMARAGRVWTDVLAGSVDADAVVSAAEGLAAVGLMWDAARLAGHGAAKADDRKVAAQLLACARELHPNDGTRRPVPTTGDDVESTTQASADEVLSERELEVARLVVQGKTYAEIGESIFISPRTAEHHIAHIRRRLGATSRSELLARLRQLLGDSGIGAGYSVEPP
ncbi:LuxR C-terminal-related transcriptional regulator [Microbacterium esteraromaticum]|uniref:LuxR C-terminal-related transcriptional regulator n=1 Tax=Microbacterium esteraromaticum TaxID=57043 RepID=UPI001C98C62E|nr:LuxR C-terminal-related transcriptional regulator [Microbacterium esteraromaticum]MBY6060357.1 helix-turn-helix transcriptional regulator [Microbacterium esteraromaticum]